MTILRYGDNWGADGKPKSRTLIFWECDLCHTEYTTNFGRLQRSKTLGRMCLDCHKHGPPLTRDEAFEKYPQIVSIVSESPRGGIATTSLVKAKCPRCLDVYKVRVGTLKKSPHGWVCKKCQWGQILNNHENLEILFPAKLPEYIVGIDMETLGRFGQVVSGTTVEIKCPKCNKTRMAQWSNVRKLGQYKCRPCATAEYWDDDEYRAKMLTAQLGNNGINRLHRDVLLEMNRQGIYGFESEQQIGRIRVDEADHNRQIVLEIFGDYWHCNPAKYNDSDMVKYPNGNIPVSDIRDRDGKRLSYLCSLGYKPYILWEKDFRDNPTGAIRQFDEWLMAA